MASRPRPSFASPLVKLSSADIDDLFNRVELQLGLNERLVDKVSGETSADGPFQGTTLTPRKDGDAADETFTGRSFADASRCFTEQLAAEEELLGEFIKSDSVARETLEHLKAMHAENMELKERVGLCDATLQAAETQIASLRTEVKALRHSHGDKAGVAEAVAAAVANERERHSRALALLEQSIERSEGRAAREAARAQAAERELADARSSHASSTAAMRAAAADPDPKGPVAVRLAAFEFEVASLRAEVDACKAHAKEAEHAQAAERASLRARAAAVELEAGKVAEAYTSKREAWVATISGLEAELAAAGSRSLALAVALGRAKALASKQRRSLLVHASKLVGVSEGDAQATAHATGEAAGSKSDDLKQALSDATVALVASRRALGLSAERERSLAVELQGEQRMRARAQALADQLADKVLLQAKNAADAKAAAKQETRQEKLRTVKAADVKAVVLEKGAKQQSKKKTASPEGSDGDRSSAPLRQRFPASPSSGEQPLNFFSPVNAAAPLTSIDGTTAAIASVLAATHEAVTSPRPPRAPLQAVAFDTPATVKSEQQLTRCVSFDEVLNNVVEFDKKHPSSAVKQPSKRAQSAAVAKENAENAPPGEDGDCPSAPRPPRRPAEEACTPARKALACPLQEPAKHDNYARGLVTTGQRSRAKVALALELGCLAGKGSDEARAMAMAALGKVEAANRRPLLLLRDDGPEGRPAFRGLYIQVQAQDLAEGGEGEGILSRVFGSGPETFFLADATCFFAWSDVDRRFTRLGGPAPAAFPTSMGASDVHHQVAALGPTVIAVGYNPISRKFLKKQHEVATNCADLTWKIYEKPPATLGKTGR